MKSFWVIFAVFVGMAAFVAVTRLMAPDEVVPWRDNFVNSQKESVESGKPLLLYFTASWCGPCQQMKRTTWADANVEQALRGFVPVKVDVDQNAALAQKYAVNSIPKVILLDKDGGTIRSAEGYQAADEFLGWLGK